MPLSGEPTTSPIPKGEPVAKRKARKRRLASKVVESVRRQCVERDGDCRLGDWENNPDDVHDDDLEGDFCEGRSEWAHLGDKKRFKTRGQAPEVRHTTAGSLMLCTKHHQDYDQGRLAIEGDDANGILHFESMQ